MTTYEYLVNLRNEGHAVTPERIVRAALDDAAWRGFVQG